MTKKNTILVGGCFDILHFGHIYFINKAKDLGDNLIVALESDETITKIKGIKRPIHTQLQRKNMLLSLKSVDEVIMLPEMKSDLDYYKLVEKIKPDIIAVTKNDPNIEIKRDQAIKYGAKLNIIPIVKNLSTSGIIEALNREI